MDAFNDILSGGFGTPDNRWVFRWVDSDLSRAAPGHEAMARWVERVLRGCHPSNRATLRARLDDARQGWGPTMFDTITKIIRNHGGIVLELR